MILGVLSRTLVKLLESLHVILLALGVYFAYLYLASIYYGVPYVIQHGIIALTPDQEVSAPDMVNQIEKSLKTPSK